MGNYLTDKGEMEWESLIKQDTEFYQEHSAMVKAGSD